MLFQINEGRKSRYVLKTYNPGKVMTKLGFIKWF
jgi:hypothetical protein